MKLTSSWCGSLGSVTGRGSGVLKRIVMAFHHYYVTQRTAVAHRSHTCGLLHVISLPASVAQTASRPCSTLCVLVYGHVRVRVGVRMRACVCVLV